MDTNAMELKIRSAYEAITQKKNNRLRLPVATDAGIKFSKDGNIITLALGNQAIRQNMQTDAGAFEAWMLAFRALSEKEDYFKCNYTIKFQRVSKPKNRSSKPSETERQECLDWQNYQRLLFRVKIFEELFGREWFQLSEETKSFIKSDSEYSDDKQFVVNTGGVGRGNPPSPPKPSKRDSSPSEKQLEWDLCKSGKNYLTIQEVFDTKPAFRQFPVGIFEKEVGIGTSIFPRGKACIDLVADGKDDKSFWIFELKKSGNASLGIISELLFYVAIVRDLVSGKIKGTDSNDDNCYKLSRLNKDDIPQKNEINACFLAPDYHPLFFYKIIDILNDAFNRKQSQEKQCSVVFHKANLDPVAGKITIIKE